MNKQPSIKPLSELPEFALACIYQLHGTDITKIPKDLVVTYFDAIYTNTAMPQDLFVHECVHFVRQGSGENEDLAKEFCIKYVEDPQFRYEEELLAYREQYKFLLKHMNKPQAFIHAKRLAMSLSGALYGSITSYTDALSAIIKK